VLLNLLPKAVGHGAEVLTGAKVRQVTLENGRAVGVSGGLIDPKTFEETGTFTVKAEKVIVSAGTLHTPELLYRSGVRHPLLGQNLTLQPHFAVLPAYKEKMESYRGIPQSVYISEFDEVSAASGLGGYRLEPGFIAPGMMAGFINDYGPSVSEAMAHYNHLGLGLLLLPDKPTGHLVFKKDKKEIHYTPLPELAARVRKGLRFLTEFYLDAGATAVFVPTGVGMLKITRMEEVAQKINDAMPLAKFVSPHPQGTCRLGSDPDKSVLDLTGQVRGVENLYVCDGSVFPSSSSHHVTVPIVSMSSKLAAALA
jgi:choline dehydrogenase-like flavoprotein